MVDHRSRRGRRSHPAGVSDAGEDPAPNDSVPLCHVDEHAEKGRAIAADFDQGTGKNKELQVKGIKILTKILLYSIQPDRDCLGRYKLLWWRSRYYWSRLTGKT